MSKCAPPYIPFTGIRLLQYQGNNLGLFLGDIAYLLAMAPKLEGLINFTKCKGIATVIQSFLYSQVGSFE